MTCADSNQFYANLPVLSSFFQVPDPDNYLPLPDDWYVGITDIENSTKAVKNAHYKKVNILGVSPIVGILNKSNQNSLPYSFGGDGASICFPPDLLESTRTVFAASQQIGKKLYDLKLRAAVIPVSYIRNKGFDVKVARFRVSDFYNQAVFSGGGLNFAEEILKSPESSVYHLSEFQSSADASFEGLECRWKKVRPENKSVLSILVQCNSNIAFPEATYDRVLKKMRDFFGFDEDTNPVTASQLTLNIAIPKLMEETKFRTFGKGWLGQLKYLLKMVIQTFIGKLLMYFGFSTPATNWKIYKSDLVKNTDHRKFDDLLRMVISGTPKQKKELQQFLQARFEQSELAYGIHSCDSAMITCMVFAYHRHHVHFVDGSDGGYVKAAKALKKRLKVLRGTNGDGK